MRKLPLYLFMPGLLAACAGNDYLVQRQGSMEGRLEQVMQAHNSARAETASLAAQVQDLRELTARQATAVKDLQTASDAVQTRLRMLTNRLEQLEPTARQAATIELVNQEGAAAGRDESVQAAYMKAFGLFSANNYPAAAEAFNSFIASYPESEYVANARYWLGECYFSDQHYKEAIEAFSKALDMKPSAGRSADAMMKIGLSWQGLGETAKGEAMLKSVIDKYPGSDAAQQAKKQLGRK